MQEALKQYHEFSYFLIIVTLSRMARPQKMNADYFSHDTWMRNDMKVKALRRKYWMEWYAVYVMMLEIIASCDNFECILPMDDVVAWEVIAWDIDMDSEKLKEILTYAVTLWLFIREWENLYSSWLKKRLQRVVDKRNNMRWYYQKENPENEVSGAEMPVSGAETEKIIVSVAEMPVSVAENTQSKVKQSKEKKRKYIKEKTVDDSGESSEWDLFELFWKNYPKKMDKKVAQNRFLSLSKKNQAIVLDWLNRWNLHWKSEKTEMRFIPLPSTWLNKERWKEIPVWNNAPVRTQHVRVADWFDSAEEDAKQHEKEVAALWKKFYALSNSEQESLKNQAISECERYRWKVWFETMVNWKVLLLFRTKYNL